MSKSLAHHIVYWLNKMFLCFFTRLQGYLKVFLKSSCKFRHESSDFASVRLVFLILKDFSLRKNLQLHSIRKLKSISHFLLQLPRKILSSRFLFMTWVWKGEKSSIAWLWMRHSKVNNNIIISIKLSILITSIGEATTHKEKTNFLHNSSNCIGPSFVNLVIKTHQFLLCFQSWLTLLKDKISLAISIPEEKHMHLRDTGPLHLHLGRTYRIIQESMFPEMVLFHFLA